ncbi:hypothetical protein [Mycobacterium bohemicum]
MPQFAQHLLTDGRHSIELRCRRDHFAHLPLLVGGQSRAPRRLA